MKLAIAARTGAQIIDLSHEIPPYDVAAASRLVVSALKAWESQRTLILVAVVDPGVGTDRRILVSGRGNTTLLAPDNGLLNPLFNGSWEVRALENRTLFGQLESTTFHGRDRFAPAAAALAEGFRREDVGPLVEPAGQIELVAPIADSSGIEGWIVSVDRFGNCISNVPASLLGNPAGWFAEVGSVVIREHAANYEEKSEGQPFLIVGSDGMMEISISRGSAADLLQSRRLDRVKFRRFDRSND